MKPSYNAFEKENEDSKLSYAEKIGKNLLDPQNTSSKGNIRKIEDMKKIW